MGTLTEEEQAKQSKKARKLAKAKDDERARNDEIARMIRYREADFLELTTYRLMRNAHIKDPSYRYYIATDNYCPYTEHFISVSYKDLDEFIAKLESDLLNDYYNNFSLEWIRRSISKINAYLLHERLPTSTSRRNSKSVHTALFCSTTQKCFLRLGVMTFISTTAILASPSWKPASMDAGMSQKRFIRACHSTATTTKKQ
ncbi:hypothetical protein [Burkholderia cenocepacia]|uniref:hypothetical protein n=1 Tax=Burkholderia cenocepacia TaxID=95486 RepID=UPI00222E9F6A|nr:hypothetical protein [Burkholderia cenocepacia]MCW3498715.1 hypothetical protein [Burkholderia cenocepacia]MCW3506197.1 hypothetical protein [Burkholderia cenocepacia]MCW3513868.1 hypothetical protein [Burkholderia cenocepacia]MCW3529018.1 hypothetical protein [Burkholderia cenocepacia]MCW3544648.1 hypothetical protein [Burkholderia cenocepacia]